MSGPPVFRLGAGEAELDAIERLLGPGAVLIFPTDTLYGLGGRARDRDAALRTRAAKGRHDAQPLPVVAADPAQIDALCPGWRERAGRLAEAFWPGPLTLVVPAGPAVPEEVTSGVGSLAVRVPAHAVTRRLCARLGPLVATSANRSGEPPPRTCGEAVAAVGEAAAAAVDAGPGGRRPSTIVSLVGAQPRLVRAGAVAWERVLERLG